MTTQENTLELIKTFGYNARQVAEILGIVTKSAQNKMKEEKGNRFSDSDFQKLLLHFQSKIENQSKKLEEIKATI